MMRTNARAHYLTILFNKIELINAIVNWCKGAISLSPTNFFYLLVFGVAVVIWLITLILCSQYGPNSYKEKHERSKQVEAKSNPPRRCKNSERSLSVLILISDHNKREESQKIRFILHSVHFINNLMKVILLLDNVLVPFLVIIDFLEVSGAVYQLMVLAPMLKIMTQHKLIKCQTLAFNILIS